MQVKLQRAVSKMKYMFGQLRHERAALTGHQYVPLAGAGVQGDQTHVYLLYPVR